MPARAMRRHLVDMYIVGQLMTRDPVTLKETDTLEEADRLLALEHIRHLPVVRGGKLVGLLTHRDLLAHCGRYRRPTGEPITAGEVMRTDVTTVRPETPLIEAIRLMLVNKFGCLPVVDEGGTLVGIVTETDLLRVAAERVEEIDRYELAEEYRA